MTTKKVTPDYSSIYRGIHNLISMLWVISLLIIVIYELSIWSWSVWIFATIIMLYVEHKNGGYLLGKKNLVGNDHGSDGID